jgi:multidrug resistance efflux pump
LSRRKGAIVKDQAQPELAEANFAKDSAQEEYTRAEAQRYTTLMQAGLVRKETLEQMKARLAPHRSLFAQIARRSQAPAPVWFSIKAL